MRLCVEYGNSIYLSTTLLYVYCRNNMPKEADRLFREMREEGLYIDIPAYTTLINAHYKANNL